MLADLLQQIHTQQQLAGEQSYPAAPVSARAAMHDAVRRRTGTSLPRAYDELLAITDGLDFNGLVIYGCVNHGILAMNDHWCPEPAMENVLILGDNDCDLLAWYWASGRCARLDRVSWDVTETFDDAGAMLVAALRERL